MTAEDKALAAIVAKEIHAQNAWVAAQYVADFCKIDARFNKDSNPAKYLPTLQIYLHQLMENGGMIEAAQILWTPNQFTPEPESVRSIWNLFETSSSGLIMGAAAMGKSFSLGVRLFMEWIKDPEWTGVRVIGPSEDHLEQNLFSHLVSLHSNASLPMPGEIGDLFIGMNRRNQTASIRGIVIPKGNNKKAGRLQGGHRKPRLVPHPKYGPLSRMFIFIDEIENVPTGIWHDVDNVLSEVSSDGGFKLFGAYNPTNLGDEVAKRVEPAFGFENIDEEVHYRWKSLRGWDVLRLDAEKCENVIQNKIIYPGLQTREGLARVASNAGGRQSSGYMTMGRGMYPKQGMEATMVPPGMLAKMKGEYIWLDPPQPVGGADLALEGGDDAIYCLGKFGLATGIKYPPSLKFPKGETVMFKDEKGRSIARHGLIAEHFFVLPKGDTVVMSKQNIDTSKKAGVRPEYYACDRTGAGAGTADMIRNDWSGAIHDVNYSEGASVGVKLMTEDTKTCDAAFDRMASELWFALRAWAEFSYLLLSPNLDMSKLMQQLTQRRYRTSGVKSKVESKKDYESRGYGSPNEADALTLLVHAARKGSGVTLSMKGDSTGPSNAWEDDWPHSGTHNGVRVDPSNQSDYLDTREEPLL